MIYKVNEIFHSLQGEGFWTGTPMTFVRLSGCYLSCKFCDTDHEKYSSLNEIAIFAQIRHTHVCITGGEPTEQDLTPLLDLLKGHIPHLETNGMNPLPYLEVWITVSPKQIGLHPDVYDADEIKFLCGKELPDWEKIIQNIQPLLSSNTELYIMPIYGLYLEENVRLAIEYAMKHPKFRLTVQQHKLLRYK